MAPPERYYIDESMMAIAKGLAIVRPDVVHPGHPACPDLALGVKDTEWLPIVGNQGWAVIMRDKRIRSRHMERQRLLDHGVRAFCLTSAGNQTSWQMLEILVRNWSKIEEAAAEDGPFIYGVTIGGLSKQRLPGLES